MKIRLVRVIFLLFLTSFCDARRKTEPHTRNEIENVDRRKLEELIQTEEFLAVFFYTKPCKNCDKILQELEKIDEDAESFGLQFVKNSERGTAKTYGVTKFPSLAYFRNKEPVIYDGDLMKEDSVLAWLTDIESMELPDAIEEVNAKVLQNIIDETEFVAVLFYKQDCKESDSVLHDLEEIDDDASNNGIAFVKVSDQNLSAEFGLDKVPSLIYYRNKVPLLYDGDLHNEKLVLNWLVKQKDLASDSDFIDDVSSTALSSMIDSSPFLAVLFYDKDSEKSQTTLLELEAIDDDTEKNGIPFVKIDDDKLAAEYGIEDLPTLVYYEKKVPNFYPGNLSIEEEVLEWLIQQKESDEIEDVSDKVLAHMIRNTDYLAVLFYDSKSQRSKHVLEELEAIDDDADKHGIPFVKIDNEVLEAQYGIVDLPVLVYYENQVPKFYEGDLTSEESVLEWLVEQMSSDEIEDVSAKVLKQMVKTTPYLAVLFYDSEQDKSMEVIKELENIDDEADQRDLPFIKIDDDELARSYGIDDELPVLVYFEKEIPSLYQGDLKNEEEVLEWLVDQMTSDEIEEVSDKLLDIMITKHKHLAVLFYDSEDEESDEVLHELEKIDDEADQHGIIFVRTDDIEAANKYGIESLPSLVFFDKQLPNVFSGDPANEDEVLEWFVDQLTKDEIEDVTEKMLLQLVERSKNLAVLFYDKDAKNSQVVLKELENIDDDAEKNEIPFVKIDDDSLAKEMGLNDELPILVYFENKLPSVYEGNLLNEEEVLAWLIQQMSEDSIEEVTEEILEDLIEKRGFVLVFFAPDNCKNCDVILKELENIDDETDDHGILFVTTDDTKLAKKVAGVSHFPALVLFRNGEPLIYEGDLMNEEAILHWVTSEDTLDIPDEIEEVSSRMLEKLMNTSHSLAVFFYKDDCPECEQVMKELENIDDEAEQNGVDFVKVSDPETANEYNVVNFPTLVFFRKDMTQVFEGNLSSEELVLQWLVENKERPESVIEYFDKKMLTLLLEETETVAVYFYEAECSECDALLHELEHIDDDTDKYNISFVKTDEVEFAQELGVSDFPCLVYFENQLPSLYEGELTNEEEVLEWLVMQKTEDTMENINRDMLFRLIEEQEYLAVYFYIQNDKECKEILKHLEQIDDDCSDYEVQLVKMSDTLIAKKYKIRNPPGLVFFRHGLPIRYPGDLTDEEDVLEWLTSPENMESSDAIEKVNKRMFERVLQRCDFLAVFFYRRNRCRKCVKVLEELEKIDDDAESEGIHFVKIEDDKLAKKFGAFSIPSLAFFKYGDMNDPVIFAGDMKSGEQILDWLITQKDPSSDMIEDMDGDELEELIDSADYLAVLFYDPDEEDCPECQSTLSDLENIDDDTDRHGILFVKTTDDSIAREYGIKSFPALLYFENNVPSIYEGDVSAEEEVLQWLIHSKSEDTIETVNKDMCDRLIESTPYLVVLFYKSQNIESEEVVEQLENIDHVTDEYGVQMVKTQDSSLARRYGIKQFPALVYFRNTHPLIYPGDLLNEEAVLEWLLTENIRQLPDAIEEVSNKMLDKLIETSPLLAVYLYEKECEECLEALEELEEIDEEADLFGIGFVKVSDPTAASKWNVHTLPSLAYFRKGVPVFYEGSLSNVEGVLDWLTSQDMIELKNEIEEVNKKMLDKLLQENDFISVYFYDGDCPECDNVLHELESIDDEIEELDILFVKIKDPRYARKYGMKQLPAMAYFRKRFPAIFRGNLTVKEEVLSWLKKNRYRLPELNLFMFAMIAMSAAFIQYTLFLIFCINPMLEK